VRINHRNRAAMATLDPITAFDFDKDRIGHGTPLLTVSHGCVPARR
jgi:hypothetical protein